MGIELGSFLKKPQKLLEIAMVCYYLEKMSCSLQPVSPFFQSQLNSQEFMISNIVVPLRLGQILGKEWSTGGYPAAVTVPLLLRWRKRLLWEVRVQTGKDRSSTERFFQLVEIFCGRWIPGQRHGLVTGQGG